jgi:hypothetical protein
MNLIVFATLLFIIAVSGLTIFWINKGRPDRKTNIYTLLMALGGAFVAFLVWVLYHGAKFSDDPVVSLAIVYGLAQLIMLGMGFLHVWMLYRFMWSGRDKDYWERDSLLAEVSFSIWVSHFMLMFFCLTYYLITKSTIETTSFWGLFIPFLLPFATVKLTDLMNQIPAKEFDTKWYYQLTELDETRWNWANTMIVGFQVVDAYDNEEKFGATKAWFTIQVPRDQPLVNVYRLALRVYHEKHHTVPIQDIGYETNPPQFWWLFYNQFNIFKPSTWFVRDRYFDPYATLEQNKISNHLLVTAKRMSI